VLMAHQLRQVMVQHSDTALAEKDSAASATR
jgi:hypothetical protein